MLQREIPHVAHNAAEAVHWVAQIFQGYTGDWGDFDRGAVQMPELVQRIARRTGLAAADVQTVVDGVPRELQPIPESVACCVSCTPRATSCTSCPTCRRPMPTTCKAATTS
jgi:hypothetical protein